jgi:membrane fusion protein, multidrug efflux system
VNNQIDPASGQLRLKATLPNQDSALWPGQFVNVRLLVRIDHGVATVPSTAIQRGPDGTWVMS